MTRRLVRLAAVTLAVAAVMWLGMVARLHLDAQARIEGAVLALCMAGVIVSVAADMWVTERIREEHAARDRAIREFDRRRRRGPVQPPPAA